MSRRAFAIGIVCLGAVLSLGLVGCAPKPAVVYVPDSQDSDLPAPKQRDKKEVAREKPGATFTLPNDATGKILARVLPPTALPTRLPAAANVASAQQGMRFRLPESPPPRATSDLLRLRTPLAKGMTRPEFVLEESLDWLASPGLPKAPVFATGRLEKEDTPDVSLAPPLPVMATAISRRISLDDPTLEVSTAAVLTAPLLSRTKAVPFERPSKPEPYANRIPLTLPVPEEGATPRGPTPTVPR